MERTAEAEHLSAGPLEIRPAEHAACIDGRTLPLTRRELQVLTVLVRHEEHVLSREQIYEEAWGGDLAAADRSVDVYVSRLRRKLGEAEPRQMIHTHSGIGYRFSFG